jgi:hypothetical protein
VKRCFLVSAVVALTVGLAVPAGATPVSLGPKMLRLSQMPRGWVAQPSSSGGGVGCLRNVFEPKSFHQTASAEVTFAAKSGLPQVDEKLAEFGSPVSTAFARIVAHLDACHKLSGTSGGRKLTGTVAAMSLPSYGAQSAGFKVTFKYDGLALGEYALIARQGNALVGLTEGTLGLPNLHQFETFAALALQNVSG